MEKNKTFQKGTLLDEAAQIKIYGGTSIATDSDIRIYITKSCKTWGDCNKVCDYGPRLHDYSKK